MYLGGSVILGLLHKIVAPPLGPMSTPTQSQPWIIGQIYTTRHKFPPEQA